MKKRFRSIVVNNETYTWAVKEDDWPQLTISIWRNDDKNQLVCRRSFITTNPITPPLIRDLIESLPCS